MKVFITKKIPQAGIDSLREAGLEISMHDKNDKLSQASDGQSKIIFGDSQQTKRLNYNKINPSLLGKKRQSTPVNNSQAIFIFKQVFTM